MKKIVALIFLCVSLFFNTANVHADVAEVTDGSVMPGVNCGMADAPDGNNKCCYQKPTSLPSMPGETVFYLIPGAYEAVDKYNGFRKKIDDIQSNSATGCVYGTPSAALSDPGCTCKLSVATTPIASINQLCTKYVKTGESAACSNCASGGGYWSGMGCIPLNVQNLITNYIFSWGIGFAGGIALLCIIYSAFMMQTSMGNAEALKKAQENLTACITGLILVIFSVFILRLIGVSILRIPFLMN